MSSRILLFLAFITVAGCEFRKVPPSTSGSHTTQVLNPENAPLFFPEGRAGVVPDSLVFKWPESRFDENSKHGFTAKIEPEVGGKLVRRDASTLVFVPSGNFANDSEYTITLQGGRSGADKARRARFEFSTGEFKLINIRVLGFKARKGVIRVGMSFSGDADLDALRANTRWSINGGRAPSTIRYQQADDRREIEAVLHVGRVKVGDQLGVTLGEGVEGRRGRTTESRHIEVALDNQAELKLIEVVAKRTAAATVIDVICDDESQLSRFSYWQSEPYDYHYISRRCEPQQAHLNDLLTVVPAIEFQVTAIKGGFRLHGPFEKGRYTITLKKGFSSTSGATLKREERREVVIGKLPPSITFVSQGRYLPPSAWERLPVRHVNVDTAQLTVRHIPRDNLIFWMAGYNERGDERTSNRLVSGQLTLRANEDEAHTSWLEIQRLIPKPEPGVYELALTAGSAESTRRLLLTNLNLVAKRAIPSAADPWRHTIWAWALDAEDNTPVQGVLIEAIRESGYVLGTCRTDVTGGCQIQPEAGDADRANPFALIASKGADFTYLKYSDLELQGGSHAVHGEEYTPHAAYRGTIYGDRGVYRPGDTAHFGGLIRTPKHLAPKAGLPVTLEVVDPRRKTTSRSVRKTNSAGMISLDFAIAPHALTGRYHLRMSVGNNRLTELPFLVETIVPERMKVEVTPQSESTSKQAAATFDVSARYLFGGTAAGSRVDLSCELLSTTFAPPGHPGYSFGRASADTGEAVQLGRASRKLDEAGKATLECPGGRLLSASSQPSKVRAVATVYEAGSGRVSRKTAYSMHHPGPLYIGVKANKKRAHRGQEISYEVILTDRNGELVRRATDVQVELLTLQGAENRYLGRGGKQLRIGQLRENRETIRSFKVTSGRAQFNAQPMSDGTQFMVRVSSGQTVTELRLPGRRNHFGIFGRPEESGRYRTARPSSPSELRVVGPAEVKVGGPFEISFQSPYRGRALITLESNRVLYSKWVDVRAGLNVHRTTLHRFEPNVYAAVFLAKDPHLESRNALLPERAYGVKSLRVIPEDYLASVDLVAPKEAAPHDDIQVSLDLGRSEEARFVTVAAVDEGLLSLTRFKTPDPLGELFARRRLAVDTFDTIGWALQIPDSRPNSSQGGDLALGQGAANPVKPVALWSGVLEVPRSGRLTVPFRIPQYRGELRVMAVAAGHQAVGRAETRITVRDPLVLQTTLPRFLTQGDRFEVPVFVTNMTEAAQEVQLSLKAEALSDKLKEGPVRLLGPTAKMISLRPGESARAVFAGEAIAAQGGARLSVSARAADIVSFDSVELPVVVAGTNRRKVSTMTMTQEAPRQLETVVPGAIPGTELTRIWASTIDHASVFSHLDFLVRYPYGCVEQTTSGVRPLLFSARFFELLSPGLVTRGGGVNEMVQAGISRVLSMQTPSGGLGYWPGATRASPWGTAYATDMLIDAQREGYEVPAQRLKEILDWMTRQATESDVNRGTLGIRAYFHYVLAKAGRPQKAGIEALLDGLPTHLSGPEAEGVYLLKAALYLAGDRRYLAELKQLESRNAPSPRQHNGSFFSTHRSAALRACIHLSLFGPTAEARVAVAGVADRLLAESSRYNTQELAWGVTALGLWNRQRQKQASAPALLVNGVATPASSQPSSSGTVWRLAGLPPQADVRLSKTDGLQEPLTVVVVNQAAVKAGSTPKSMGGLEISRSWRRADGRPIEPDTLRLGDIIYATLNLTNNSSATIANIAAVDRFAAALEVENPRLGHASLPSWVRRDRLWATDHQNIRDDRVELFGELKPGETKEVVYVLRAVTAGRFSTPPAYAEAMYDPGIFASTTGSGVHVGGPWSRDP